MNFPSTPELAAVLHKVRKDTNWDDCNADVLYEDEQSIDVRLQVTAHGWQVHEGDASYDLDHSGYWSASAVYRRASIAELYAIAEDLIEQCREMAAEDDT